MYLASEQLLYAEQITSPEEARVAATVGLMEAELAIHGLEPRIPGARRGKCDFISDGVVAYASLDDVKGIVYSVEDVHETFSGRPSANDTFSHYFAVLRSNDRPFLVDLSFVQFLTDDGRVGQMRSYWVDSGLSADNPMAEALASKGYVPFTDDTLRQYLALTCDAQLPNRSYIARATVANLAAPKANRHVYRAERFLSGRIYHPGQGQTPCADLGCMRAHPALAQ